MKRLQKVFSEFEWWIIISLVFVFWLFGAYAFNVYFTLNNHVSDLSTLFYLSLQLFTLESGFVEGKVPLIFEVARWGSPSVAVLAAIKAFFLVAKENVGYVKLKFFKHHTIICGLGIKGSRLANDLMRLNKKFVVIESDESNKEISTLREKGVIVIIGNAADPDVLRTARIDTAFWVVAFTGNGHANIECAAEARKIVMMDQDIIKSRRTKPRLIAIISIPDCVFKTAIYENNLFFYNTSRFSTRIYNIYEQCAREVLERYSPDKVAPVTFDDYSNNPHLVILGFGALGQQLLLQAARIGHYIYGKKLKVTVVDTSPRISASVFQYRYPFLKNVIDLDYLETNCKFIDSNMIFDQIGVSDKAVIYVSMGNDDETLEVASNFYRRCDITNLKVIALLEDWYSIDEELESNDDESIVFYDVIKHTSDEDSVITTELDVIAKEIHSYYQNKYVDIGGWYDLPWDKQDSNRHQADHLPVKVRSLGREYATTSFVNYTEDQLTELAKVEHRRWVAEKIIGGWVCGDKRNDKRKIHDNMIAWDELSDLEKDKDRDTIRNINNILSKINN